MKHGKPGAADAAAIADAGAWDDAVTGGDAAANGDDAEDVEPDYDAAMAASPHCARCETYPNPRVEGERSCEVCRDAILDGRRDWPTRAPPARLAVHLAGRLPGVG